MKTIEAQFSEVKPGPVYTHQMPLSERVARWVSYQLCRLAVALVMALVAIFIIGSAFIQAQEVMLQAYRSISGVTVSAKMQGIKFAPDYKTAAPMETYDAKQLDTLVDKYAAIYEVDPGMARGIIMKESSWNPNAVNPDGGAHGLGQLRGQALRWCKLTPAEAKDPNKAIPCMMSWYSQKVHEQDGNESEAVQSYHCGPSCVGKRKGIAYFKDALRKYDSRPQQVAAANNTQKREG
jgi:soluble lytic murein transglycosylase-like protein